MAKNTNISNFHMQYLDVTSQHWDNKSENFAGGDHLLTAIENGWRVAQCALVRHWYAGMRSVKVYEFKLTRGEQTLTMPVIDNPYVERLIADGDFELIIEEKHQIQ